MEENGNASKRSRFIYGDDRSIVMEPKNHRFEIEDCAEKKANMEASGGGSRHRQWRRPSSRISCVSCSGGKDRHSKVLTSKGLCDRRVRLSVSTAIQFYDLQDRLGYEQPSKAIEWLIKAASAAIDELPSLGSSFAELSSLAGEQNQAEQPNPSKSGCSSISGKSSVLSLSRSEICVKARERPRELSVKEEEKDREDGGEHFAGIDHSHSSFRNLLNDQSASLSDAAPMSASGQVQAMPPPTNAMADFLGQTGFFARLPSHTHCLNSCPLVEMAETGDQLEMQQFTFMQDHMDYNFNFSIASGLAGFQRGTLQSNSSAHLTEQQLHYQQLLFSSPSSSFSSSSSSMVGPNLQLVAASVAENFFCSGLDGRLQLSKELPAPFLLDSYRPSDLKGKGRS